MATTVFKSPTLASSDIWIDRENVFASDGLYARLQFSNDPAQRYTNFGFDGSDIPGNATIEGIEVAIEGFDSQFLSDINHFVVWLAKDDGHSEHTVTKESADITGDKKIYTLGGPTDTWGYSWLPAEFHNGFFTLGIAINGSYATDIRIDHIQVKVYYSVSTSNNAPTGVDDSFKVLKDEETNIDVLANDIKNDSGDTLSIHAISDFEGGFASINPDQTINFSDYGEKEEIVFSYIVKDQNDATDTGTVNITFNTAPTATDDSITTPYETAVNIDVLSNDSDPDSDPLTVDSVTTPSNGTAVIESDDTITYTPDAGFSGTDTFDYTISDDSGATGTATVTVTVEARLDPYSRASLASLPTNDDDLATIFDTSERGDVDTSDNIRVAQEADGGSYSIQQFKFPHTNNTDKVDVSVELQTDHAPSTNAVELEIYNYTSGSWESLDTNNTASVDTDFALTGSKTGVDYYDANNVVSTRVWQFKT